jgi:tetratricopeptide (TPR) repeat protein
MAQVRTLCLFVALASLVVPTASEAQDAPSPGADAAEVPQLLAEAVQEYDGGNYQEAYALFLRVHGIRPSARTQRVLGKAAFELRRYRESLAWLEGALTDQRNPLTDEMRAEVEELRTRARAFIGRVTVHSNVPGATVDADGRPIDGAAADLDLGEHELVIRAEGYDSLTRRVSVRGGEDQTIEVTLVRSRAGTTIVMPEDPGAQYRNLGWASILLGGGLAAGGVVATIVWTDTVSTLNANIDTGACTADVNETIIAGSALCYDQEKRYKLALPLAIAGYAAGAAFLGLGFGLLFGAPSASSGEHARNGISCGPFADGGVLCRGEF